MAKDIIEMRNEIDTPTGETYGAIDRAYRHFNAALFGGKLPGCVFVFGRKAKSRGYFIEGKWADAAGERTRDEIALNPDLMLARSVKEQLSTLVHEMVHQRQALYGKPSRSGYHNAEWAEMMGEVGLHPTDDGTIAGKPTGQRVSHLIIEGGLFDAVCDTLLADGFTIPWLALPPAPAAAKKAASKTKYACPDCDLVVWAKPDIHVRCGECEVDLVADA